MLNYGAGREAGEKGKGGKVSKNRRGGGPDWDEGRRLVDNDHGS